jgi:chromate transporter
MNNAAGTYLALLATFATCSVVAVGGANTTVPEMHRQAVELHHWISDVKFSELFAIAQAAPGPNVVFVALLGQYIAGVPGALVAISAMCAPSCLIAYCAARLVDRFEHAPWRVMVQAGLVPVTIGLVAASALIVTRAADRGIATALITAASFALCYWTRVTPLVPLALAAALGLMGVV